MTAPSTYSENVSFQDLLNQAAHKPLCPALSQQIVDYLVGLNCPQEFEQALKSFSTYVDLNALVDARGWTLVHQIADQAPQGNIFWKWPLLASSGVNVNERAIDTFSNTGGPGLYPLHLVAILGNEQDLQTLLSFGADINCLSHNQETALYYASAQMARALIEAGIDMEHKNYQGLTAFAQACHIANQQEELLDFIRVLIERGADLDSCTPLYPPSPVAAELIRSAIHARALQDEASISALAGHRLRI